MVVMASPTKTVGLAAFLRGGSRILVRGAAKISYININIADNKTQRNTVRICACNVIPVNRNIINLNIFIL